MGKTSSRELKILPGENSSELYLQKHRLCAKNTGERNRQGKPYDLGTQTLQNRVLLS